MRPQAGRDRSRRSGLAGGTRHPRGIGPFWSSALTLPYDQCQPLAPARAIDREIRIQGADRQSGDFGKPHKAGVGERHWDIAVSAHQVAHRRCLRVKVECNAQGSTSQALEQPPGLNFLPAEQETGLGQYRLASQQWWGEVGELLNGPVVTGFVRAEIGHQWPGIDHRSRCHRPNSSMYFGFVA
jgi:hypothetical protein